MKYKEFKDKFLNYPLYLDNLLKDKVCGDLFYPYCVLKEEYKNLILVYFDINRFIEYNHKYGHKQGDKILAEIENILSDTIYSRDGGDSFFFIIEENEKELYLERIKSILNDLTICMIIIHLKTFKIINGIIFKLMYDCKSSNHFENKKLEIKIEDL